MVASHHKYNASAPFSLHQQPQNNLHNKNNLSVFKETEEQIPNKNRKELLWKDIVPLELYNRTSEIERKRQEIIFEIIQTENNFACDLDNLHKFFVKPLADNPVLSNSERSDFLHVVFTNILDIKSNSQFFANALNELQNRAPVVETIGDIFLKFMDGFDLFKEYGANQVYGKKRLEEEIHANPIFKNFIEKQERLPELRKLTLHSFLASPTTRLGRYPLLLEAVLKYTTETNKVDIECIPIAVKNIKSILSEINERSGAASNRVRLIEISKKLYGKEEDIRELDLYNKDRLLITEATIKKKTAVENVEYMLFLFDHYLLLTKKRKPNHVAVKTQGNESADLKIVKKPIPLSLLRANIRDASANIPDNAPSTLSLSNNETHFTTAPSTIKNNASYHHQLTLSHIGREGFTHILTFNSSSETKKIKNEIDKQQSKKDKENMLFTHYLLISGEHLHKLNINCCTLNGPSDKNTLILVGTDLGLYAKYENETRFNLLLQMEKIIQLEMLPECNLVLILSDKTLFSIPYQSIINNSSTSTKQTPRKLSSHVSFFKVGGTSKNKILVSVIKATSLSSTIKVYEPTVTNAASAQFKAANTLTKLFSSKTKMRIFREFYIPSEVFSLYYLKSKLCIGCAKGFEIVDIDTLETMGLLDPTDPELDFITKKEISRPLAFFRVKDRRFFLCYNDFGLFVDKVGRLITHPHKLVLNWKGAPYQFHVIDKYVLAFSHLFIEIWNLESGNIVQVIRTANSPNQSLKLLKGFDDHTIIYDNAASYLDQDNRAAIANGLFCVKINSNHIPESFPQTHSDTYHTNKRNGLVKKNTQ